MFLVKWAVLVAWLFVGLFVLPLRISALNLSPFAVSNFYITWAMLLTAGVFFLGAFKLKTD